MLLLVDHPFYYYNKVTIRLDVTQIQQNRRDRLYIIIIIYGDIIMILCKIFTHWKLCLAEAIHNFQ